MLTYIQINAAKRRDKAWSLSDSQGLYLVIQQNGSKLWRFRYRFLDRQKTLHLGGWPQISLADARARRDDAKKLVACQSASKKDPLSACKRDPFVEQRDGYDGRAVRAGCGVGRA